MPRCKLPRLYPILDAGLLLRAGLSIEGFARELREAGIRFLQYRDKEADGRSGAGAGSASAQHLSPVGQLSHPERPRLAGVALRASTEFMSARRIYLQPKPAPRLGSDVLIGVSTHGERQLLSAADGPADYVAIGPVFATLSKQVPDPVVGLDGVRAARAMTVKPLVAIGGINRVELRRRDRGRGGFGGRHL